MTPSLDLSKVLNSSQMISAENTFGKDSTVKGGKTP